MLSRTILLSITVTLLSLSSPAQAQTESPVPEPPLPRFPQSCQPISIVGGTGSEVTKTTTIPGLPIPLPLPIGVGARTRDNWNTDWVVPTNQTFRTFMVVLMPRHNARYSISMYLKYGDDTADKFYDRTTQLPANEPLVIEAEPRLDFQPYQVNVRVGGVDSVGVRYTVAVAACH